MRTASALLLASGLWLASAAPAWAGITVNYVKPDEFTDVPRSPVDRERLLAEMTKFWTKLAADLPPGQDLSIDVLDVDLAGRSDVSHRAMDELRIMRGGADWPRIDLRYTLSSGGQVVRTTTARLTDMTYLNHFNTFPEGEPLRYEKQMMSDWFQKEFGISKGQHAASK